MRTLTVFFSLVAMSIKSRAQYPTTTLLAILTSIMMFSAEFFLVYFLVSQVGNIQGWSPSELAIMYVAVMLAGSLEVAFTDTLRNFDNEIINGGLDTKILRPIHPLAMYLGQVSVDAVAVPIFCLIVLAITIRQTIVFWSPLTIFWYVISILGGALIFTSITIFSSALAFWTQDSNSFYSMAKKGTRQLLWYPLSIYSRGIQVFFVFLLPFAFIGYFPAILVTGKTLAGFPEWLIYLSFPVGLLSIFLSVLFWQFGLRYYQSSGS